MKSLKNLMSVVLICFAACTGKEPSASVGEKKTVTAKTENVMLQAMNNSMMAMHHAKQTGNPDHDFATMMIPHHEGAVAMADALITAGKSKKLRDFANKIITNQGTEIKMLRQFLATADQHPGPEAKEIQRALTKSMTAMMDGMKGWKSTGDLDKDFVQLMIPHHQSAVDMAKGYLPYAKNAQMKSFAKQVIETQYQEIEWLKANTDL